MFAGKKSAQIREILINESAWEEMTCLFALSLKEMDNAQQVRALPDVDYGLIQGNFAVSSGMSLTSALKLEAATSHFINVVTVAGKNQKAQFAKDIIDGYHSAEFKKYILSHPQYDGYLLPDYLK